MEKQEYEFSLIDFLCLVLGPFVSVGVGLLLVKLVFWYFPW